MLNGSASTIQFRKWTEGPFKWLQWLTLLTLPAPFIWLEVGPRGFINYGHDVPDIYILGGFITGKDLGWLPILGACIAQFAGIVCSFACVVAAMRASHDHHLATQFLVVNAALLGLFPLWLDAYVEGVIHNSDGADLTVHPRVGLLLYVAACVLTLWLLIVHVRALLLYRASE